MIIYIVDQTMDRSHGATHFALRIHSTERAESESVQSCLGKEAEIPVTIVETSEVRSLVGYGETRCAIFQSEESRTAPDAGPAHCSIPYTRVYVMSRIIMARSHARDSLGPGWLDFKIAQSCWRGVDWPCANWAITGSNWLDN